MLKQRIAHAHMPRILWSLRSMVADRLAHVPEKLALFRITPTTDSCRRRGNKDQDRYVFETDSHTTAPFFLDDDGIEIEHVEDHGSVAILDMDSAAEWIARELAEVA